MNTDNLKSYKRSADAEIRLCLGAPHECKGFVEDSIYIKAMSTGVTAYEFGNQIAQQLIEDCWIY